MRTVRCWVCKHDVSEETTVSKAGVGTQCKDSKVCRSRAGTATCAAKELKNIVAWLRSIPEDWIHDWGLNATAEIADMLESGRWRDATELPGEETKP